MIMSGYFNFYLKHFNFFNHGGFFRAQNLQALPFNIPVIKSVDFM